MHGYKDRKEAAGVRKAICDGERVRRPLAVAAVSPVQPSLPTVPVPAPSPAFAAARDAMTSGCAFLISRGRTDHPSANRRTIHGKVALRRAGNCLRELDRLLSILLDECVGAGGMANGRLRAFERSHDTSRKLRRVDRLNGCFTSDTIRLRAIERIKEVACNDQVLALVPWASHDMAVATAGMSGLRRDASCNDRENGRMRPWEITDQALGVIAVFYLSIAKRLFGYYGVSAVQLDFSTDRAQTSRAIVACDGI